MAEAVTVLVAVTSVLAQKSVDVLKAMVDRAIAGAKRITRSGLPDQQAARARARPEDKSVSSWALLQAYALMAVTGFGYLALTWSTVVLLGGFVTSLEKKDFWCLTGISMVQAARIFNDSADNMFPLFLNLAGKLASKVFANPVEGFAKKTATPSRPKIQKLIDTLGWRSSNRELRELAARIVAYLAGDIHLSQFPGAMRCISSLLDANQPYWNNEQGHNYHLPVSISKEDTEIIKEIVISIIKRIEKHRANNVSNQGCDIQRDGVDSSTHGIGSRGDGWNELILQGLKILERLALDQHNCSDICSTPGLLPKIMAPLYSKTLIQDINVSAWADVANGSLKVVHRLMRAPEWIGTRLAHDVSSSKQAVSNLESLLEQANKELLMRAIEILTELAFDSSTDLGTDTKENLIKKQLQIFLTDDEGAEEKLRVTAGKSLALLSKIKTISKFITMEQNNIVDRLNEMLDANNNITYSTVALLILENLCTHCVLDKDYVKEALLPKVLTEVMDGKRDLSKEQKNNSAREENQAISGPENDEEKQLLSKRSGQIKSPDQANNEEQNAKMEFREALLSLTLAMYDELVSLDEFDDVARKVPLGEGEFLLKLTTIVEENCEPTADHLRIVKLCGQIVVLMLKRSSQDSTTAQIKECVESLSRASGIMSNLESCMLFVGTDCGVKKTARPLLSDLAKEALKFVGN